MATLYGRRALIFILVALAIVLALDVARNLSSFTTAVADAAPTIDTPRLAYYVLLRACFVLPSVLPIAAFVAVLWAEYGLAVSLERQMIAGSGRSPLRSLFPALVFGLALGVLQFGAAAYLRPLSVEKQANEGMRYFGSKFVGETTTQPQWFALDGTIINARIRFGNGDIQLREVRLFRFNRDAQVESLTVAETAVPGPDADAWTLSAGTAWDVAELRDKGRMPGGPRTEPFHTRALLLPLSPLWVENFDVTPNLLDQKTLSGLVEALAMAPHGYSFLAALSERFSSIFYCLGMALLSATMAMTRFFYGMTVSRILGVATAGGVGYVAYSATSMLSVFGNLPPLIGPWLVPMALISGSLGWAAWRDWRVLVELNATIARGSE